MQPLLTCLGLFECVCWDCSNVWVCSSVCVCVLGLFECVCVCMHSMCACMLRGRWGKNACAWLYDVYSCSCAVFLPFYKYGSFNRMGSSACLYFAWFFSNPALALVNFCFIEARWRPSFKTGNGVAEKILAIINYWTTGNNMVIDHVRKNECEVRAWAGRWHRQAICSSEVPSRLLSPFRAQELCESRDDRPGFPVPNSPYGLCGRKATLN